MKSEFFDRIRSFSADKQTPFLVVDLPAVERRYRELDSLYSWAEIFYAIKANPAPPIVRLLRDLGSSFDVASVYELDQLLALGADPGRISFGNTIKKGRDIAAFYERGIRLFATDAESDLRAIAEAAPGSRVFARIVVETGRTCDWPLSRKFGCESDQAVELLKLAPTLGLEPYGVSFHVGSQQREIGAWRVALEKVKLVFDRLRDEAGIRLQMINLGGGLPGRYIHPTREPEVYAAEIRRYLDEVFHDSRPRILIEPGRGLVADAGVVVTEVVLAARRSPTALWRWIYTDAGVFNGLMETTHEAIKYPIWTERMSNTDCETEAVVLAGPTCDSDDVMYEEYKYQLPAGLTAGERLYWLSAGAYTASYSSVGFNGFPPLREYYLD